VALTAAKLQKLGDAGLIALFEERRQLWQELAAHAYGYTAGFLEEVRPDDVIQALAPALEVSNELRRHLAEHRLPQQYWFTWFGELILDRLWDDLVKR
jgi:hypothetical protein